jgi:hypothetical protein
MAMLIHGILLTVSRRTSIDIIIWIPLVKGKGVLPLRDLL